MICLPCTEPTYTKPSTPYPTPLIFPRAPLPNVGLGSWDLTLDQPTSLLFLLYRLETCHQHSTQQYPSLRPWERGVSPGLACEEALELGTGPGLGGCTYTHTHTHRLSPQDRNCPETAAAWLFFFQACLIKPLPVEELKSAEVDIVSMSLPGTLQGEAQGQDEPAPTPSSSSHGPPASAEEDFPV